MKTVLNIKNLVGTIVIVSTSENKISEEIEAKVIKALLSALNQVQENPECNSDKSRPPVSDPKN